jgi:hypothetical protein
MTSGTTPGVRDAHGPGSRIPTRTKASPRFERAAGVVRRLQRRRPMQILRVMAPLAALLLAAACDDSAPPPRTADAAAVRDIDRDAAIATAWQDASANFPGRPMTQIGAHRLGSVWVVELQAAAGGGLRYAISAHDGTIRQRNTFQ